MGIQINDNTSSSILQRSLYAANKEALSSIEKLSYGKKMKAMEDAAGSIISAQLQTQSRGSNVAAENAQTGSNLLQTAESDLGGIGENLQRMRELAIKAANGTNGPEELEAIKSEFSSLASEIDRVSSSSSFNDIKLLDGSNKDLSLQIGGNSDSETNSLNVGSALESVSTQDLGIPTGTNLDTAMSSSGGAAKLIDDIDKALSTVSDRRSQIGSYQNVIDNTVNSLQVRSQNLMAANSRISDTDVAQEYSNLIQAQIKEKASVSLLAQANQQPAIALSLL